MITKSTDQLKYLLDLYYKFLPRASFPYLPFVVAAFFQSMAWLAGPIFLNNYSLIPRMIVLILFAVGEYTFMSPAMNAGVEILGMRESSLVIGYHAATLLVFAFVNIFIFKKAFEVKYACAFLFSGLSVYFANS
jgi:uncharacterized protein (DUF486 family)